MNNFKACAHCGDKCIVEFEKGEFKLRCDHCPVEMKWFTDEDSALEAWNKRANNCDEASYFENGVELAINILERHKMTAEKMYGKDCAPYHLLGAIIEEIEAQLDYAMEP